MKSPSFASLMKCVLILGALSLLAPLTPADPPKSGGKPKFTNRLAKETSPYLLMHAHNPTDWYPWGPEAFAKAKKEGKLVFLSIGYSSCYWCHVMERESFANEAVAKILNKYFVPVKVDREARPDIDQIYMTALTLIQRGSGGWPLSMFLTPDGKPVVGFTYRPAEDKKFEDGSVQTGFKSIMEIVQNAWKKDRKALIKQADQVASATKRSLATRGFALIKLDAKILGDVIDTLKDNFDTVYGGFGSPQRLFRGPKFPTPPRLQFLLQRYSHTKNPEELAMVTKTLDNMALGGIYDQLGGGFHRYSTERTWTVPHFEKMLYDNGQLLEVYAKAYRLTKKPLYRRILKETIDYIEREMMSPEGAIYSSQDAETHEEEGRSYVWTDKEIDAVFPEKKDNAFVRKVYGADGKPNFEGKYHILMLEKPFAELAKEMKMTPDAFRKRLLPLREKMFQVRNTREQPFKNKIALTSWSGLAIAGLAEAGQVFGDKKTIELATKAADFVLKTQRTKDGKLLRTYGAQPGKKPKAEGTAYLDDYAFLTHGLLSLYEATGDKRWLGEAKKLTDTMIEQFKDKKAGGYFFTSHDSEKLFARSKDQYDGAVPSGNSVAALNLVRLWQKTGEKRYVEEAERSFKLFVASFTDSPTAMTTMAEALDLWYQLKK